MYMQKARQFFKAMAIEISSDQWNNRVGKFRAVTSHKKVMLSPNQLKEALTYGRPKLKAEIAFLICAGWRRDEITKIRMEDVDFSKKPARVYQWAIDPSTGKQNKTGNPSFAFLSKEAVQLIQDYRKNYLTPRYD